MVSMAATGFDVCHLHRPNHSPMAATSGLSMLEQRMTLRYCITQWPLATSSGLRSPQVAFLSIPITSARRALPQMERQFGSLTMDSTKSSCISSMECSLRDGDLTLRTAILQASRTTRAEGTICGWAISPPRGKTNTIVAACHDRSCARCLGNSRHPFSASWHECCQT